MINFPILHKVSVENYQLYTGNNDSPGLNHTFQAGVNVIVGINGLGKTTLLNILLRSMSGPYDYPFGEQLGSSSRRAMISADRSWFRRRVPDDGVHATVYVEFWLGEDFFSVKRSLHNLDLLELTINQQIITAENKVNLESLYQLEIQRSSNLSRYDDFIFLLRYFIFFLEDRRSLVWDTAAQSEALGILFGNGSERRQFIELFNELASLDSQYRNTQAVVNKYKKSREKNSTTLAGGQLGKLVKELEDAQAELNKLTDERQKLDEERKDLRNAIENAQRVAFDSRSVLAKQLDKYYESFFPSLNDSARYLLSHFDSGAGCLVCGTDTEVAINKVKAKLTLNACPVCDSPIEHGSEPHTHDPYMPEEIAAERVKIDTLHAKINAMEQKLTSIENCFSKTSASRITIADKVQTISKQLTDLGESAPAVQEALVKAESEISAFNTVLSRLENEIESTALRFRELAKDIDIEVQSVSTAIEQAFAKLISGFLAEDCKIAYTTNSRSIGQLKTEQYPFPHFLPALTSGVFRHGEMVRQTTQSVSESQREFIDLAFRMAILQIAAPNQASMLVLETPEASLDSVFIPRAANLLRRFATRDNEARPTRLIASSNVNRELMIPALFGVYPDHEFEAEVTETSDNLIPAIPVNLRSKHVLDLLTIAAPTRALEEFRVPYEKERDRAIYPEHFVTSN